MVTDYDDGLTLPPSPLTGADSAEIETQLAGGKTELRQVLREG
jgi:hypothetical protein